MRERRRVENGEGREGRGGREDGREEQSRAAAWIMMAWGREEGGVLHAGEPRPSELQNFHLRKSSVHHTECVLGVSSLGVGGCSAVQMHECFVWIEQSKR